MIWMASSGAPIARKYWPASWARRRARRALAIGSVMVAAAQTLCAGKASLSNSCRARSGVMGHRRAWDRRLTLSEAELRAAFPELLAVCEEIAGSLAQLDAQVAPLRREIDRLKGEQGRPP